MKEPHNYRVVGYSMIVIAVTLSIIGLVVWAIGDNYHFGSNLMAGQEVDSMTPKQGYNIVSFDYTAPIGSKLRLLDHTDSINDTKKLQAQYQQSVKGAQILVFGNSHDDNVDLMAHAEIAALTPTHGYNIILFNHAYPVGAKLSLAKHDDSQVNATKYQQQQKDAVKDPDVSVIIFGNSYEDNLITVLGSGSSTAAKSLPTSTQPTIPSNVLPVTNTSVTTSSHGNESVAITEKLNTTSSGNQTTTSSGNQTNNGTKKSVNLNENMGITSK
jgi:hypothetical protein